MAGEWYTTRVIKPMRIFQTNVNTEFSIYEKTGLRVGLHLRSPYIIYCYREMISNEYMFNSKLNLIKLSSDRYKLEPIDTSISNSSIVDVLVIESDQVVEGKSTLNNDVKLGEWSLLDKINANSYQYKMFEINKENNYTLDITSMNIKDSSEKMIFFIKNMKYLPNCYHIKIEAEKLTSKKYSIKLKQKYCDKTIEVGSLNNLNFDANGLYTKQKFKVNNAGSVKMEVHCESSRSFYDYGDGNHFKVFVDNIEKSSSGLYAWILHSYVSYYLFLIKEFNIQGKGRDKEIEIRPVVEGSDRLKYFYKYYYTTTTSNFFDVEDYSIIVYVIGESL